jgi:aminopeptidase N
LDLAAEHKAGHELFIDDKILDALFATVKNKQLDDHFKALMLSLPELDVLMQKQSVICVESLHAARKFVEVKLAKRFAGDLFELYRVLLAAEPDRYVFEAKAVGRRTLKNKILAYLCAIGDKRYWDLAAKQFKNARGMTDERAALAILASTESPDRQPCLDAFYKKWQHEELVVDAWFNIQTSAGRDDVLSDVRKLLAHPDFKLDNPNRARSVLMVLPFLNPRAFHHPSGEGYVILAENVAKIAKMNGNLASRLVKEFGLWKKLEPSQREKCREQLEILAKQELPKQVFEVVNNLINR